MTGMSAAYAVVTALLVSGLSCQQPKPAESPPAAPATVADARTRDRFELKRVCSTLGFERTQDDLKGRSRGVAMLGSKYCYSEVLNTCIYSASFIVDKSISLAVIDLLTNEELLTSVTTDGRDLGPLPQAEFQTKEEELFRQCIK